MSLQSHVRTCSKHVPSKRSVMYFCPIRRTKRGSQPVSDQSTDLRGKVAVVTGAGHGLGRAEALALARAGARLTLNDLPGDAVHAVAEEIRAQGGEAAVHEGDVAEWATGEGLLKTALTAYGSVDV